MNRFQGFDSASLCSLAGRYDNPVPSRFLAPIDCLKIPALTNKIFNYHNLQVRFDKGHQNVVLKSCIKPYTIP